MALVIKDRIKETATTTGTGTFTLGGAVSGFQAFSEIGNGNTTYYCIEHATENEFEVGLGTYTLSGTTLARTTIITSSNAGNAVNFSAGDKNVFVTVPATKTIKKDASDSANITSSDVTSALGFTPISSADGGNAATLDSLDSTSFLRSDATDTFTGNSLFFLNTTHWQVSSSDTANQRADSRDDGTNFSRLHWYGVRDNGATSNFRHAWYDGSAYVNITAASGQVAFGGKINVGTSSTLNSTGQLNIYRSDGSPYIGWYYNSTTRGGYLQYVSSDYFYFGDVGYTESVGSFRAPIFYDSDNTAYYANLTSADVSIVTNADIVTSGQYGAGVVSVYSPTKNQGVWSMGTSYRLPKSGVGGGSLYGLAWSYNPNYGGSGNNAQSISGLNHQLLLMQNGSTTAAMGSGVWTSGNVTAYSDIRVKTNIERIPDALNKVMQLNGYTFDRTDQGEDSATGETLFLRQTGVIAQEVLPVLPEAVIGDEETHYSVAYGNMVGLLIEAIKELNTKIDMLKE